jgi:hypothetical protein
MVEKTTIISWIGLASVVLSLFGIKSINIITCGLPQKDVMRIQCLTMYTSNLIIFSRTELNDFVS